jgi:hypothetical protein
MAGRIAAHAADAGFSRAESAKARLYGSDWDKNGRRERMIL